jgi:hypothetical protein
MSDVCTWADAGQGGDGNMRRYKSGWGENPMTREQKTIRKRAKDTAKAIKANKSMKKKDRKAEAAKVLEGAEKDIQTLESRKTGNTAPENAFCIYCERKINTGDYRIIGYRDGEKVYRHDACAPGSARWMKSKIGQTSGYRRYFKEVEEDV